jgi:uncharacterized protein
MGYFSHLPSISTSATIILRSYYPMKTLAIIGLLLFGSLSAVAQSQAQAKHSPTSSTPAASTKVDPAKEADIRQLLALMGTGSLAGQTMDNMEKSVRPLMTKALPPGEYREKLVELFFIKFHTKRDSKALADMAVPIYDKYYSEDEIKGLIQFYATPLGQKMLTVLPKMMNELQKGGGEWGEDLGRQCMLEVLVEHPDLAKALDLAKKEQQPQ